MTRTTTSGSGADWRFTAGQPDAIDAPSGGSTVGEPPILWMTGGDVAANADPALIGMDRILNGLVAAGHTIGQPNVPNLLGSPACWSRINDCIAYLRAHHGASDDPPIIIGVSNGSSCGTSFMRIYPISGFIGILPVVDATQIYVDDLLGYRHPIEVAFAITYPAPIPSGFDPWRDIAMWDRDGLRGLLQVWATSGDLIYQPQQFSFWAQMWAEFHNVGNSGHLGTLSDATVTLDAIDLDRLVAFVAERIAAL